MGRAQHLRAALGKVGEQAQQAETRREGERRLRFVEQVEARRVKACSEDLEERLAVAELVEPWVPRSGRVLLEVGEEAVHGLGPEEVGPAG